MGGVSATEKYVVIGDRDLDDFQDVFRCYDAKTGEPLWQVQVLAIGKLDYGNTPRSTALIDGDRVFLAGAFGDVLSVDLATGETHWKLNLRTQFGVEAKLPWGYCGSPLLVDGKLVVQPGATDASLVALDPTTGKLLWKSAGNAPSYGSLIAGEFGGKLQIVGHDASTLGGWDLASGKRLWQLKPEVAGDFNVPTPLSIDGKLLVSTENNGTRLYRFHKDGTIDPQPVSFTRRLAPDMSSAVRMGDRIFCAHRFLIGLDLQDGLREVTRLRDRALGDYGSIIANQSHLLATGKGEVLLIDVRGKPRIASRMRVFDEDVILYSHPAIVGKRLFIRGESALRCIALD